MNQGERGDWAKNIDGVTSSIPVSRSPPSTSTGSVARLVRRQEPQGHPGHGQAPARAGIDVAILGPSEMCTGDPARRSGNEYLFQMLAMPNVEMLNGMGVRKIITQCPHCFNTLKNEYPQLGGNYEVVHHTQLLESLIEPGKLDVSQATLEERITYHDSCYLGRHNDVYLAPRKVVGRSRASRSSRCRATAPRGMCCGAGGARMWMEESIGTKVNDERAREAISTGASRVATACPFCYIMLDDGVKAAGVEETEVRVADISIHLLEAIESGERNLGHQDAPPQHLRLTLVSRDQVRPCRAKSARWNSVERARSMPAEDAIRVAEPIVTDRKGYADGLDIDGLARSASTAGRRGRSASLRRWRSRRGPSGPVPRIAAANAIA
jgi:hypothetical protein